MPSQAPQSASTPGHNTAPDTALAAALAHKQLLALQGHPRIAPSVAKQFADQSIPHRPSIAGTPHSSESPQLRRLDPRSTSRGASRRGLLFLRVLGTSPLSYRALDSRIPVPVTPVPAFHSLAQVAVTTPTAGSTPGEVPRLTPERRVVPRLRPGPFRIQRRTKCRRNSMNDHAVQSLFLRAANRSKCFQQY